MENAGAYDQEDKIMKPKTGKLRRSKLGWVYKCEDCKTSYPEFIPGKELDEGLAWCNGHQITLCPWCRPDSQPWKWGRGI